MKDQVLQTRVSSEEAEFIAEAASKHGLKVAAYLRKVALMETFGTHVNAWVARYPVDPAEVIGRGLRPQYVLRRRAARGGEQTFFLLHPPGRHTLEPVSPAYLADVEHFLRPWQHEFVLEGSSSRWFVVRTTFDATAGAVELVLRPEGTPADSVRSRIHGAVGGPLFFEFVGGSTIVGSVDLWDVGADTFELKVNDGTKRTVHFDRVLSVAFPPVGTSAP